MSSVNVSARSRFGFACGARLSCALLTFIILVTRAVAQPESRWPALSALVLAGCVTILWYVPAFVAEGYSFGFVKVLVPEWWGGWGLPARWVYKNIYLFGLPAVVGGTLVLVRRGERPLR